MPEPEGDDRTIDSLLQQIESHGVPQYMNGDTLKEKQSGGVSVR
jgi:hypothetical protein